MTTHHGTAQDSGHFSDTIWARLIALAIGLAVAWALWTSWHEEILAVWTTGEVEALPTGEPVVVKPENPALNACLEKRVGDVDQMRSEGVINDSQYADFRQRAEDLCRAQNPL